MQTFHYPNFPPSLSIVHIALFTNVSNSAALRARIVAASTMEGPKGETEREAVNFAFVDAKLVTSPLHIQTAVYQSILAAAQGSLLTKTVHSEVIWYLNPTNNITEALRRFGVSDQTTSLLLIRVDSPDTPKSVIENQMKNVVSGELLSLASMRYVTDWGLVKKYYKLNADAAVAPLSKNCDQQREVMNEIVCSLVSIKTVAS